MDLFQPSLRPSLIRSHIAHQLASTFGLTVADVRTDARDVATWVGPDDALLAAIEKRRWLAPTLAVIYLENLRTALAGQDTV